MNNIIKNFIETSFKKGMKYNILLVANIILTILFVILLTKGIMKYSVKSNLSQINGRSVSYSVSQNKIVSTASTVVINPVVATPTPAVTHEDNAVKHDNPQNTPTTQNNTQAPAPNAPEINKPAIAILVSGVGLSASTTDDVEKLPSFVTIGLSPYSYNLDVLAKKYAESNREILVDLPLEPINYPEDDAGPFSLLTGISEKDNLERLNYLLNRIKKVSGVYSSKGERFTSNEGSIKDVIKALKSKDIAYVYAGESTNVVIQQVSKNEHFPLVLMDFVIDDQLEEKAMIDKLNQALAKAKKDGFATIMCRTYPITLYNLKKWLDKIDPKDISFVGFKDITAIISKAVQ